MKLFTAAKIPVYVESVSHRLERRKSGDVKVVDLGLRIMPFTAQLASALDPGEYGFMKRMLFKQGNAEAVIDLKGVEVRNPSARQKLICFASPDTVKATIAIDQVKVTGIRARKSKDSGDWTLIIHVSFGPVDKTELEFCNAAYTEQRFISWEPAEPGMFDDDATDGEENDEDEDDTPAARPTPMFDTEGDGTPVHAAAADEEPANRPLHSHAARGRKQRH